MSFLRDLLTLFAGRRAGAAERLPAQAGLQTLEAAGARQRAVMEEARGCSADLEAAEARNATSAHADDMRALRLALDAEVEGLRLRAALFRSDRQAIGASFVSFRSAGRSGETLEELNRRVDAIRALLERARALLRAQDEGEPHP